MVEIQEENGSSRNGGQDQCADAGPCPRSPDILAALVAAKRAPLLRRQAMGPVCPGSSIPTVGWWPKSPYSEWAPSNDLGGPWPIETIAHLCQLGLMTTPHDDCGKARITKSGLALLRGPKKPRDGAERVHEQVSQPIRDDQSSPPPSSSRGDQ